MLQPFRTLVAGLASSISLAFRALFLGLVRAFFGVKSVVLLYLTNFLFGLVMAVPVYCLARTTVAQTPDSRGFLSLFDAGFLTDLLHSQTPFLSSLETLALLSAAAYFVVYAFLQGGVLASLADRRRPLNFTTFFAACGRYLFPFFRVLVPAAVVLLGLALLNDLASSGLTWWFNESFERAASAGLLGWILTGKTILFVALFVLLVVLPVHLARIRCVMDNDRFMLRGYWKGLVFALRSPFTLLLFFGLSTLLVLALYACQDLLLRQIDWTRPLHPLAFISARLDYAVPPFVVYLLLTQVTIFLLQAALVARAGGLMAIYADGTAPPQEQDPELAYAPSPVVDAPSPRGKGRSSIFLIPFLLPLLSGVLQGQSDPIPVLPGGPFSNEYTIAVSLDAERMMLDGVEDVLFRNLSDGPVDEIPFHLYPNAWANTETPWVLDGRARQKLLERGAKGSGYLLVHSVLDGSGTNLGDRTRIEGTIMRVRLLEPLGKGKEIRFRISFQTKLPRIVARMGKVGRHVNAMQWFPKLCAHQNGRFVDWPFRNPSEFFADFGKYLVTITVPEDYVLEATGVPRGEPGLDKDLGTKTVAFLAEAVHDFAWCASPNFVRHAEATGRGTEIVLLSQPYLEPKAELTLRAARTAMERLDEWIFPYPYPRLVIEAHPHGQGGGMEYPMLFTIGAAAPEFLGWFAARSADPASVTVHEFSHQYWYGMVATNEFEEAWLDEGITTYMTHRLLQEIFPGPGESPGLAHLQATRIYHAVLEAPPLLTALVGYDDSPFFRADGEPESRLFGFSIPSLFPRDASSDLLQHKKETYVPFAHSAPLKTLSWEVFREGRENAYYASAYSKPALMLKTLEGQIGWDRMRELIRAWSRRYAFQHPTSEDFIALVDEQTGGRYHDFLVACVHGSGTIDYAVEDVRSFEVRAASGFLLPEHPGGELQSRFSGHGKKRSWLGRWFRPEDPDAEERGGAEAEGKLFGSEVYVRNRGELWLETTVELRFSDGTTETVVLDEERPWYRITPEPREARLVAAVVDPAHTIALDLDLTNNGRLALADQGAAGAFGAFFQFWAQSFLAGISWFS
ncbi:MAG: M1 family metallopeptidase [Planctomycetota bacterium]